LLRDAAEWRLLGRLFECPDDQWNREIATLARELTNAKLRACVDLVDAAATAGQYYSVFGPGGPAPPREASHHESLELGSLMSELAGYYDAFGYSPHTTESPDHVAIEAGFVGYLKLKEAFARAQGDDEHAEMVARAATRFSADHLSRIATPLAKLLAGSHLRYLAEAARVLAERVGPPPRSARLPMLPLAEDAADEEMECGLS
jgi:nitrate reductase assembly molybdenum cofactor insertion protein NarJ